MPAEKILRDDGVVWVTAQSRGECPDRLRRVTALVELGAKEVEIEFLTNNLAWAPSSIASLYCCRWQIELFIKQITRTLQLCNFLGHRASAVRWRVWIARAATLPRLSP
jgi:IS4 transposase